MPNLETVRFLLRVNNVALVQHYWDHTRLGSHQTNLTLYSEIESYCQTNITSIWDQFRPN